MSRRNPGGEPDVEGDLHEGARSGTRLKLRYYDFGNVRELFGIQDAQLADSCRPREFTNDATYCLPDNSSPAVYADDNCTQLIAMAYVDPCASPPPAYYYEQSLGVCSSKVARLFRRGAPLTQSVHYTKPKLERAASGAQARASRTSRSEPRSRSPSSRC